MNGHPYIRVLSKTEVVDDAKWRLLPKAVKCDGIGEGHRHWIPETNVVWPAKVSDMLFDSVRLGKATLGELSQALKRIDPQ